MTTGRVTMTWQETDTGHEFWRSEGLYVNEWGRQVIKPGEMPRDWLCHKVAAGEITDRAPDCTD